jgi:hypothetical protein
MLLAHASVTWEMHTQQGHGVVINQRDIPAYLVWIPEPQRSTSRALTAVHCKLCPPSLLAAA